MSFLTTIGIAIADTLRPIVKDEGEELLDRVVDKIGDEFEKRIPAMTAALVTAVAEAAVVGVDKITDVIPGQLDDEILDPIVARAVEIFRQFGLGR
jgi:hypothetical protein